jgi:hypothetical protein
MRRRRDPSSWDAISISAPAAKVSLRGPVEPPASCATSKAYVAYIEHSIRLNAVGIMRYYERYVPIFSSVADLCQWF